MLFNNLTLISVLISISVLGLILESVSAIVYINFDPLKLILRGLRAPH